MNALVAIARDMKYTAANRDVRSSYSPPRHDHRRSQGRACSATLPAQAHRLSSEAVTVGEEPEILGRQIRDGDSLAAGEPVGSTYVRRERLLKQLA